MLQRKWDVGDKFADSDADEVLPTFKSKWTGLKVWKRDESKGFSPKAEHTPVGNKTKWAAGCKLSDVWLTLTEEMFELVWKLTNDAGQKKMGASWVHVSEATMMRFNAVLLRMSVVKRNNLRSYFSKKDGDHVVLNSGLSRRMFERIYTTLKLFNPVKEKERGWSNKSDKRNYDTQYRFRPVWNKMIRWAICLLYASCMRVIWEWSEAQ